MFFTLLFCNTFSQTEDALIKEAKALIYLGFTEGDYSGRKKADSLLNSLVDRNDFSSVKNEILANLYIIFTRLGRTPDVDLNILNKLIEKYQTGNVNDPDLLSQLTFFRNRMRLSLGEKGAEEAILKTIENQLQLKIPNDTLLADAYDILGREYYKQKKYEKSVAFGKKSIPHYQKANLNQLFISSLQATGAAYYNYDRIDSSLYFMKKAYTEIKKNANPNNQRMAQLAFNIGVINQGKTGEYFEAEAFLKEAISYEIKANGEESPTLITYYSLLADNFFILKDIDQAEFYANKAYSLAYDILKTESVYLRSFAAMSLSKIYVIKKDFDRARKLIDVVVEESIAFYGENDKFTSQAFNDKAFVEFSAKNYEEAEKYLLRSLNAAESIDRVYSKKASYSSLNEIFLKTKVYDKALYYAKKRKELLDIHLKTDYKISAIDNIAIAKAYLGLKYLDSAQMVLKEVQKKLPKYVDAPELELELRALQNEILLEKYKSVSDDNALEEAYKNIEGIIKKIISGKSSYSYQNSRIFYSESIIPYINTSLEICQLLFDKKKEEKVLNTIFKLMEINKSSILLDGITDFKIKVEKRVSPQIMEEETITRVSLMEINEKIYKLKKDSTSSTPSLNILIDKQLKLNVKLEEIQDNLKKNYPEYYKAKNLVEAKPLDFYQKEVLKKGQCIVEYYISEERLYRLVISKNKIQFDELPDTKRTIGQVENFLSTIQNKGDIISLSKQLGSVLLPEFPLDTREIIFITDGVLSRIPFEILNYKNGYLLENYYVSYAGSLQLYDEQVALHKKQNISLKWLGFAPDYKDKSLATNKKEVSKIAKLTKGEYKLGQEATKQNFINTSKNASILHLATHAELDKGNPMLNKMIFYDNGEDAFELTAAEIYGLDLKANLAVLSACETGSGIYENDGVMSMSRAFAYAGVPSTVMSLWKVPDAQTSIIMVSFYENLDKGQQKNEALANAKLSYLESVKQPELKHPYYWAGFVVSGDISPIHKGTSIWWYVLAIMILILLVFIFLRRRKSI